MAGEAALVHLRDAGREDMPEVARLYGHYVETTVYTFEEAAPDAAEMARRWQQTCQAGLPWRIAESRAGGVLGYAYAGRFRGRSAYRYTVENSIYVAAEQLHRGVGLALMRDLIRECTALGYRQMIAVIGDSANEASIRLHTRLGFRTIGHQVAVGLKFGRWVDVVEMQLALGDGAHALPSGEPLGYART
ncbi:MAG TPA: GNAT family N-acetyltransferase [Stellaceae bacterium]|nr:GNAT family N-acetyltransferase [Stellaceae bacterium]